jgi:hypothetical protein
VAAQNVDELWQLVETGLPQEPSDGRHARVAAQLVDPAHAVGRDRRAGERGGHVGAVDAVVVDVAVHGAKLEHLE